MPHQCTKCGKVYPDASKELLNGCECKSKFFYYIRQERIDEIKKERDNEVKNLIKELERSDKTQIEKDIREITGMDKKENLEKPVILDLESVKVIKPGKFEIDVINLFNKRRPLIYKLEEGKYIIDLAASFKVDKLEVDKKIRDPDLFMDDSMEKEEKEEEEEEEEEETESASNNSSEKPIIDIDKKEKEEIDETEKLDGDGEEEEGIEEVIEENESDEEEEEETEEEEKEEEIKWKIL